MKIKPTDLTKGDQSSLSASPNAACRVWLVRELIVRQENPKREEQQDCFVLALTAIEAAEIVGETQRRRIIRLEEVCPISMLPGNKYKVVTQTQDSPKPK